MPRWLHGCRLAIPSSATLAILKLCSEIDVMREFVLVAKLLSEAEEIQKTRLIQMVSAIDLD